MKSVALTPNLQVPTPNATYLGEFSSIWALGFGSWELGVGNCLRVFSSQLG